MTALGEKIKFLAAIATACPISSSPVVITFGRVDHVEAGVERAV